MRKLLDMPKFEVGDILKGATGYNYLVIDKNETNYKLYWINPFRRSEQLIFHHSIDYVDKYFEKVV
jgi:hypothetical protein